MGPDGVWSRYLTGQGGVRTAGQATSIKFGLIPIMCNPEIPLGSKSWMGADGVWSRYLAGQGDVGMAGQATGIDFGLIPIMCNR